MQELGYFEIFFPIMVGKKKFQSALFMTGEKYLVVEVSV